MGQSIIPKKDQTTTITVWKKSGRDKYGNPGWASPIALSAYWEDGERIISDDTGQQVVSRASAVIDDNLSSGDYVFKGTSGNASPPSGAYEVKKFDVITNFTGDYEKRAFLS